MSEAKEKILDQIANQAQLADRSKPPVGGRPAGYHGQPVVKPPVWTWEVPVYFFVGGASGMAGLLAWSGWLSGNLAVVRPALLVAVLGALSSPLLLVRDLGRPARFLNMLRVFKLKSAMSVGSWTLVLFSIVAVCCLACYQWARLFGSGESLLWRGAASGLFAVLSLSGVILASYTGVLLGVSVIPCWNRRRCFLPVSFTVASLGSAAAGCELILWIQHSGSDQLWWLGVITSLAEAFLLVYLEVVEHAQPDHSLVRGRSGAQVRLGGLLAGPAALVLRLCGFWPLASLVFLAGAIVTRFGWVDAGRASVLMPAIVDS